MYIKQLTNTEFSNFINNYSIKSIYQTPEYGFVMNKQGYDSVFIGLIENNNIIGASLILIKKEKGIKYAYAPRGFLINYEDFYLLNNFTTELKIFLNKINVSSIKINPLIIKNIYDFKNQDLKQNNNYNQIFECLKHFEYHHLGYNNYFEALKPRFEAIIDLTDSSTMFNNIKKEYRTKIRSAINNGIKIYNGNEFDLELMYNQTKDKYPRDLNYFKDCYYYFSKNNMIEFYYSKLNCADYLKKVQATLINLEQKGNDLNEAIIKNNSNKKLIDKKINIDKHISKYKNEIITATNLLKDHPEGIILSCILLIKQGNEITILMDSYNEAYKRFNGKHVLIWHLMDKYSKLGFKKFNLGGLPNIMNIDNKYKGLNQFKLGFNSKIYEYIGDLEFTIQKKNYILLRGIIK